MTVYVEYTGSGSRVGILRTSLWADTPAEGADFAARLGVAWVPWQHTATVTEAERRRAILMGAIPVHTGSHQPGRRGELSGVAA